MVEELGTYPFVLDNPQYSVDVDMVKTDLESLAGYRDRMLALGASDLENQPAQQIATQQLNPISTVYSSRFPGSK